MWVTGRKEVSERGLEGWVRVCMRVWVRGCVRVWVTGCVEIKTNKQKNRMCERVKGSPNPKRSG